MRQEEDRSRAAWRPGTYDVVVIGARVAGASTAMLLGRAGFDVLLIDRAPAGADTTSTHTILRSGVLQLKRWGLLDRVAGSGAPPIRRVTLGFGGELTPIDLSDNFGVDALYAPRRDVLDPLLVEAAVDSGVEYVDRCRAKSLIFGSDGAVRGVEVERSGQIHRIEAPMVVGADGVSSRVAEWVGAAKYSESAATNSVYYAYYRGIDTEGVYFQFTPGVTAGLIPTNDGLVCVYGGWHRTGDAEYHGDPEHVFGRRVGSAHPKLERALSGATRVSQFRGTPGLPGFMRTPGGRGWALVGDSGYTKDPVSAHGMSDAFRDAELCASAVEIALRHPADAPAAFERYRSVRDTLSAGLLARSTELAAYQWDEARASTLMRGISSDIQQECEALERGVALPLVAVA